MRENKDQETGREFQVKLEQKLKSWSKFIAVFLIATSGVLGSFGLIDNINTREVIEEPILDELFQVTFLKEKEDSYSRSFQDFSSYFFGKIDTRMVLSFTYLEFKRTSTSYLSFILLRKNNIEMLENFTLSIELLFQLEEVGSGISLEADGNPGGFELWLTESGDSFEGMLEFHLFVYARIFSPSIEYLGPVLSLILVGLTLFRFGYTNYFIDRIVFAICGLGGMPLGALLVRHTIPLYSFFYLPYLLAMIFTFIVCLIFILKSCSLGLSSSSNTS